MWFTEFFLPVCDLDMVVLWLEEVVLSAMVEVELIRSPSAISLLFIQNGILGWVVMNERTFSFRSF